jgi:hypothetical protein
MKNTIYAIIGTAGVMGIIAFVAIALLGPFITIWGLNTLFHLGIPYTFETYLAVIAVSLFFNVRISTKE